MRIRTFSSAFATTFCLSLTAFGTAHAAGADPKAPIYIDGFKADQAQSESSSGLFSHLGASHRTEKVEKNAAALADALVHELNAEGVVAYRLSDQHSAPSTGWVVKGVFSENVPRGGLLPNFSSSSAPNTEVTLSITDLTTGPGKPAVVISTPASLGGQGSSVSFNPYVLAAKVVVHKVQSDHSIDDLAKRIAAQIVAQRA